MNAQAMPSQTPAVTAAAQSADLAALDRLARQVAGDPVLAARLAAAAASRGLHAAALAEGHDIGTAPLLLVIMRLADSFDHALAGGQATVGDRPSA